MKMPSEADDIENKDMHFRRYYDRKQEAFLRMLVCDQIIEEHRQHPLGQHSEPLGRLLMHFRRKPIAGKLAVRRNETNSTFRLVAFSGERGVPPRIVDDAEYATVEEAYHAIFLRQIQDLLEST